MESVAHWRSLCFSKIHQRSWSSCFPALANHKHCWRTKRLRGPSELGAMAYQSAQGQSTNMPVAFTRSYIHTCCQAQFYLYILSHGNSFIFHAALSLLLRKPLFQSGVNASYLILIFKSCDVTMLDGFGFWPGFSIKPVCETCFNSRSIGPLVLERG